MYLVELAEDELSVLPIHRLLSGLPAGFDLAAALDPFFEPRPAGPVTAELADRMDAEGALSLVLPDEAWLLVPRPEAMGEVRDLDTSRLDVALAALPPHELVFQHGIDLVAQRVAAGDAQAGVLLRPATVDQIIEIAHGGERMPPKTTFFHPKPAHRRGVPAARRGPVGARRPGARLISRPSRWRPSAAGCRDRRGRCVPARRRAAG